jgi:hypothetical protein
MEMDWESPYRAPVAVLPLSHLLNIATDTDYIIHLFFSLFCDDPYQYLTSSH